MQNRKKNTLNYMVKPHLKWQSDDIQNLRAWFSTISTVHTSHNYLFLKCYNARQMAGILWNQQMKDLMPTLTNFHQNIWSSSFKRHSTQS